MGILYTISTLLMAVAVVWGVVHWVRSSRSRGSSRSARNARQKLGRTSERQLSRTRRARKTYNRPDWRSGS